MKIWQDVLLIGIPLKQLIGFPDLRSSHTKTISGTLKIALLTISLKY